MAQSLLPLDRADTKKMPLGKASGLGLSDICEGVRGARRETDISETSE